MRNQMQRLLTAIRGGHWMRLAGPVIGAYVLAAFLATNVGADTTPTTYYACVNMKTGAIYMINAGDTCQKGYTPMSWNQVGPQGPAGPTGSQGPAGPTQTLTMTQGFSEVTMPPGSDGFTEAFCPTGTLLTGGGYQLQGGDFKSVVVYSSVPDAPSRNAWEATAFNPGPYPVNLQVIAVCASLA